MMSTEPTIDLGTDAIPEDLVIVDPALASRAVVSTPHEVAPESSFIAAPPPPVRERIRVLFVTYDDVLTEGSLAAKRYASYGALFEEVHVIVPTEGDRHFDGLQLAQNVWAYPTNSSVWWMFPWDAYRVASRQLMFAGAFRADVITSSDPFELGMMAWCIARRFKRPLVVEASERLYDPSFLDENDDNMYRTWFAQFLLPRAERIRTRNVRLRDTVARNVPGRGDMIDIVPRYIDSTGLEAAGTSRVLTERYPQFTFTILVVAALGRGSGVELAINAASHALRQYPTIGMIIVGDGGEKESLAALATEKGLSGKVFFESMPDDIASFLQSASMLIMPKRALLSEEILMSAAAVGLPVLLSEDAVIENIFVDRESALVCKQHDVGCAIQAIGTYMNDSVLRGRIAAQARERARATVAGVFSDGASMMRRSLESAVLSWHSRLIETAASTDVPSHTTP